MGNCCLCHWRPVATLRGSVTLHPPSTLHSFDCWIADRGSTRDDASSSLLNWNWNWKTLYVLHRSPCPYLHCPNVVSWTVWWCKWWVTQIDHIPSRSMPLEYIDTVLVSTSRKASFNDERAAPIMTVHKKKKFC